MKKFIIKILLLALPILVLSVWVEYTLQSIPNDYQYKSEYLKKHAHDVEVLILGASDANFGINPEYFELKTFNAAHVSQSADYEYEVFKSNIASLESLKYVVITISFPFLWWELDFSTEDWRSKYYYIYYGIKHPFNLKHRLNIADFNYQNFLRFKRFYTRSNYSDLGIDSLGFGESYVKENQRADWMEESSHWISLHNQDRINTQTLQNNIKFITDIIELCRERNIKVYIVNPPIWDGYMRLCNKEQMDKVLETCRNIERKNSNVTYLNYFNDKDFVDEDFYDACHLQPSGAKKLSIKINEQILNCNCR